MNKYSVMEIKDVQRVDNGDYSYSTIWFTLKQFPNFVLGLRYSPRRERNRYNIVISNDIEENVKINLLELNIRYLKQIKRDLLGMVKDSDYRYRYIYSHFNKS